MPCNLHIPAVDNFPGMVGDCGEQVEIESDVFDAHWVSLVRIDRSFSPLKSPLLVSKHRLL